MVEKAKAVHFLRIKTGLVCSTDRVITFAVNPALGYINRVALTLPLDHVFKQIQPYWVASIVCVMHAVSLMQSFLSFSSNREPF